jgi:YcfA-like protein.
VNAGGFHHIRITGDHLICGGIHRNTDARIVPVPAHGSISIGALHDIADDAGADDFEASDEWIDEHR